MRPLDEFYNRKDKKDGKRNDCKDCNNKMNQKYYQEHKEEILEQKKDYHKENKEEINERKKDWYHNKGGRESRGSISMYKNKNCGQYIGIVVAERLVKHLFNDVEMMPPNFPGYDLVCNRGKRIDVKASTICVRENKNSVVNGWKFHIRYNKNCDFFLCIAFDNVIDCNPLIAWMIPGNEVNDNESITISSTTIHKWDKWKMDMSNAQACCDLMKKEVKQHDKG